MIEKTNVRPRFNELVLEAFDAQESFDYYDSNDSEESQKKLKEICDNWEKANAELVKYVFDNADSLKITYAKYLEQSNS